MGWKPLKLGVIAIVLLTVLAPAGQTQSNATIFIQGFGFDPVELSVPAGTTVTWKNEDTSNHTVTSTEAGFDSDTLEPGDSFQFTFSTAGRFTYFCKIHNYMYGLVNTTGVLSPSSGEDSERHPLWIPPTLEGPTFDLKLSPSQKQLLPGEPTATYGYNGSQFWGPTLLMNKGEFVQIHLTNELPEETTTHWHGFHIPAAMDGGPHQVIPAGTTWSPFFDVMNAAATYWYHPHLHEKTMEQLTYGAGGFIIIRDEQESALALPRSYGIDDIPLMITSRTFTNANQFDLNGVFGRKILTNGTLNAEVRLPAQLVRLRILNGEIERVYNLGFSDNRVFYVIATDGGLVNAPVPLTRLVISPGERYEILLDLTQDSVGSVLQMQSFNGERGFVSLLRKRTFEVLQIDVVEPTPDAITAIPEILTNNSYWSAADATLERSLTITDTGPGTPFTFDGVPFDIDTINLSVAVDTTEAWTVTNGQTAAHSFHIHDVQFKIVSRSSGPVPEYEQGWKDTFYIERGESVTFVALFGEFADPVNPYMYHCHMLLHEDEGMMGQFVVY